MAGAALVLLLLAPLTVIARHGLGPGGSEPPPWRLTLASLLYCALAFNLTFFVQELALVLPKALVPGLDPVLYHNDHGWSGADPIAELLQGTGALGTMLSAGLSALWLRSAQGAATGARLFAVWMVYHGLFMVLPQIVMGAIVPMNDVGRAMGWLALAPWTKAFVALAALAIMPLTARLVTRSVLSLATAGAGGRFVWRVAALPALGAIPLILPFRMPRHPVEVALVPVIVVLAGIIWVQAWGAIDRARGARPADRAASVRIPLAILVLLLAFFQLVLRPGVAF